MRRTPFIGISRYLVIYFSLKIYWSKTMWWRSLILVLWRSSMIWISNASQAKTNSEPNLKSEASNTWHLMSSVSLWLRMKMISRLTMHKNVICGPWASFSIKCYTERSHSTAKMRNRWWRKSTKKIYTSLILSSSVLKSSETPRCHLK